MHYKIGSIIALRDPSWDERLNHIVYKVTGISGKNYNLLILGFERGNCFYRKPELNKTRMQKGNKDTHSTANNFELVNINDPQLDIRFTPL